VVPPDDSVGLTSAFDGVLCDVKVAEAPEMPHQPHPGLAAQIPVSVTPEPKPA